HRAVRRVHIPKREGAGVRLLGIPTVADRVAQDVARRYLEPILEPVFHADSYGYRPGKSAIEAVRTARERCWRYDWVLDLDVQAYFDSIDWELMLKAVRNNTDCRWVLLYIERWLKAPVQMEDGSVVPRTAGTPQGGVISPLLAIRHAEAVQRLSGSSARAESRPSRIGPISLEAKQTGERTGGNPHAAFDEAGAGNVSMVAML